jgi:arylformamidase
MHHRRDHDMKTAIAGAALLALMASTGMTQERGARVSIGCRQEIVTLCKTAAGQERGALRACLTGKREQLSQDCRAELRQRMQDRDPQGPMSGEQELSFGRDLRQKLDFWSAAKGKRAAPLVLFVHGGGWSIGDKRQASGRKPQFYASQGYAFASTNYRLVPSVTPAGQARDIANAIAFLRADATRLGFDPDRIILMGHSAGAHLVALVATDTRYLREAGVPMSAVRGAVLLDGAGYDVPAQMRSDRNRVPAMYEAAFTNDVKTQTALSPVTHAGAPNAPRWLILHVERRDDARTQAAALGRALEKAGGAVSVLAVPNSTHMTVNRDAGISGTFVADAISVFLRGAS